MINKQTLLVLLFCYCLPLPIFAVFETEKTLTTLDSTLAQKEEYIEIKEQKILQLREKKSHVTDLEELYWINKLFYDEYFVYDSDSALHYIYENLRIANELNNKLGVAEWKIQESFILAATGLLKEATDALKEVDRSILTRRLKTEYYRQKIYLYSHLVQYSGDEERLADLYYQKEKNYRDSILTVITPNDPLYLWHKAWYAIDTGDLQSVKQQLISDLANNTNSTRYYAMKAYVLAHIYNHENNEKEFINYLTLSAIADVKIANNEIASLQELAYIMYTKGDIDRAYSYINHCLTNAQLYKNRVRVVNIASTQNTIHKAYQELNAQQKQKLRFFLYLTSILSIILVISLFYIYSQVKKISIAKNNQKETNKLLNKHIKELSEAHKNLAKANDDLEQTNLNTKILNEQLNEINNKLQESNYVKEEYVGYVFSLCSDYISKLDAFRLKINRLIKVRKYDEIENLTSAYYLQKKELEEFYKSFDAVFLKIYPNFVADFNKLLEPDKQIVLKKENQLTTELRIYALVRLGINDSVKISDFLHCSPQTVYNNRLNTRNKAIIPREIFAETVQSLGKAKLNNVK